MNILISYKLYAITDRTWLKENETLADAVKSAILGGATIVQLREKTLEYNELKELALSVQKVCSSYNVPFIINDNAELAYEIDADGVHLGHKDMSIKEARSILGKNKIIGATAKTVEQALSAEKDGADYIGSGAVFGSDTKTDATNLSVDALNKICNSVSIPVVAIGGINAYNVSKLQNTSISGVSVVSGIFERNNKKKACRDILGNLYGRPVVECITNHVTTNEVANMVLAFGASPIMAHNINEVEEVQSSADALLLNLGATDDYEAMKKAYAVALKKNHITVIDPVGVSGINYRRNFLDELLAMGSPTCIRGNASEILAIYKGQSTSAGLDGTIESTINDSSKLQEVVKELAHRLNTIIVASGVTDIISDGKCVYEISSGHAMQKSLTGSGCMLSACICSALTVSIINYIDIDDKNITVVKSACQEMGDAAYRAAEYILSNTLGIYSFQTRLFDELV